MEAVTFSPSQMHMVTLMSHIKSSVAVDQLAVFYARQIDDDMEQLWESGEWNEQKLHSLQDAHFRTFDLNISFRLTIVFSNPLFVRCVNSFFYHRLL